MKTVIFLKSAVYLGVWHIFEKRGDKQNEGGGRGREWGALPSEV